MYTCINSVEMYWELFVKFSCVTYIQELFYCPALRILVHNIYAMLFVCYIVATSDKRKKFKMEVSTDWYVAIEH